MSGIKWAQLDIDDFNNNVKLLIRDINMEEYLKLTGGTMTGKINFQQDDSSTSYLLSYNNTELITRDNSTGSTIFRSKDMLELESGDYEISIGTYVNEENNYISLSGCVFIGHQPSFTRIAFKKWQKWLRSDNKDEYALTKKIYNSSILNLIEGDKQKDIDKSIFDNKDINGNLLYANGTIFITSGDLVLDSGSYVNSDLIPNSDYSYADANGSKKGFNLGSDVNYWTNLYSSTIFNNTIFNLNSLYSSSLNLSTFTTNDKNVKIPKVLLSFSSTLRSGQTSYYTNKISSTAINDEFIIERSSSRTLGNYVMYIIKSSDSVLDIGSARFQGIGYNAPNSNTTVQAYNDINMKSSENISLYSDNINIGDLTEYPTHPTKAINLNALDTITLNTTDEDITLNTTNGNINLNANNGFIGIDNLAVKKIYLKLFDNTKVILDASNSNVNTTNLNIGGTSLDNISFNNLNLLSDKNLILKSRSIRMYTDSIYLSPFSSNNAILNVEFQTINNVNLTATDVSFKLSLKLLILKTQEEIYLNSSLIELNNDGGIINITNDYNKISLNDEILSIQSRKFNLNAEDKLNISSIENLKISSTEGSISIISGSDLILTSKNDNISLSSNNLKLTDTEYKLSLSTSGDLSIDNNGLNINIDNIVINSTGYIRIVNKETENLNSQMMLYVNSFLLNATNNINITTEKYFNITSTNFSINSSIVNIRRNKIILTSTTSDTVPNSITISKDLTIGNDNNSILINETSMIITNTSSFNIKSKSLKIDSSEDISLNAIDDFNISSENNLSITTNVFSLSSKTLNIENKPDISIICSKLSINSKNFLSILNKITLENTSEIGDHLYLKTDKVSLISTSDNSSISVSRTDGIAMNCNTSSMKLKSFAVILNSNSINISNDYNSIDLDDENLKLESTEGSISLNSNSNLNLKTSLSSYIVSTSKNINLSDENLDIKVNNKIVLSSNYGNIASGVSDYKTSITLNDNITFNSSGDVNISHIRVNSALSYFNINKDITVAQTINANVINTTAADYAELFEWLDGNTENEDRYGYFVTLDNDENNIAKLTKADNNTNINNIIGITSSMPGVIGDSYESDWHDKYQHDIFGNKLKDENGNYILSEDYDESKEYIPRSERPEWIEVGLLGKIIMIDDGTCKVGSRCVPNKDGIATLSSSNTKGFIVLERKDDTHILVLMK